jgi:putative DNA primase/helicase
MGLINFDDVLTQLQTFGLDVEACDVVVGERRRCRHKDGGRQKRGWFQLYDLPLNDGSGVLIVGSFGAFWGAENVVQKIELPAKDRKAMSGEQMEALKARIAADKKRAEAEAKRRADEAAAAADKAWRGHCKEGSRDQSEYLKRKGIESHGGRFTESGNFVIPMQDTERRTHGLQVIYSVKKHGRDKDFWPAGLAKKGHFYLIGGIPDKTLLIAEGFATAASIHQATKLPVAVAFDAGNLLPVAKALHAKYKRANILICADDDYLTAGNPGVTHARNAALAVSGEVIFPVFKAERPTDTKGPTDFNDLHLLEGESAVCAQIEAHLTALGWPIGRAQSRGGATQGGGEIDEKRSAQSIMDLDDIVDRFVPVDDGTGDYVFDYWTNKVVKRSQMVALLPAGVRGDDIKRHPVWITRGAYFIDEVGFDPTEKDPTIKLNTWRGFEMEAVQGDCENIKDLANYLCSAESNAVEACEFMLDWMAYQVQYPGVKLGSAIIMQGGQGTGKSTLFNVWQDIFGSYSKTLNQRALEDKFNSDWVEKTLAVKCEEIAASSDVWHVKGEVKDLITGDWIRSNEKNSVARPIRNRMNFAILSNETIPMPLDRDDRRFLVIKTPNPLSGKFYKELYEEINNGGVAAFFYFLKTRPLDNFNPKKHPPMTDSKRRLIMASAPSEQVFVEEWIGGSVEIGGKRLPFCPCTGTQLHTAYARWARSSLVARPRDMNQFISFIHGLNGWEAGNSCATFADLNSAEKKNRKMVIPAEDAFDRAIMASAEVISAEAKTKQRWLTEGFFAFEEIINAPQ